MNNSITVKDKANTLMDQGRFSEARSLLLEFHNNNPVDTDILLGLGIADSQIGNFDNAQMWLEKACELNTNNPTCFLYLANIQRQKQDIDNAIENYQMAIALQPELAIAHLYLAGLLMVIKQLDDAEYHYKYTISLQPDNADAYANLAQVQELLNKPKDARQSISKAFEIRPQHMGALMALGKIEKRENNYSEAINVFREITTISTEPSVSAMAYIELGHCLDRTEDYDEAYNSFMEGKSLWSDIISNIPFDKSHYQTRIKYLRNLFVKDNIEIYGKSNTIKISRPEPIFFVGFPRSGTTLTEQILNQYIDIVTTGEQPLIDNLINKLPSIVNIDKPYPECLPDISNRDFVKLQQHYWSDAEHEIAELTPNKILVDKLPLNIIELGFISRLFPNSRIIIAIRDPRDVCLSCFMQAFTPNPAMINFLSMEKTVNFYSEVMGLWLHYRHLLPLNWFQYKYEDLVNNFDKTTRRIFSFLELDYPTDAEEFHKASQNRNINTPSYQDVTKPVYTRSKDRWKMYEQYLDAHMDKLAPFIEEFGYQLNKDTNSD